MLISGIELNEELLDELTDDGCEIGSDLFQEFMHARRHRDQVDCRMRYAFYSSQSRYRPEDECTLDGPAIFMGIFARLRATFLAWHFDRVEPAGENLFTMKPTPVPDVPQKMKDLGVQKIMDDLLASGLPPEAAPQFIQERVKEVKGNMMAYLYREATKAVDKAKSEILDMMIESKFLREYKIWWENFATYPYSVMQFPCVEFQEKLKWSGGKLKKTTKEVVGVKAISPFDFWVTPDATSAHDGKAAFVRTHIAYKSLLSLKDKAKGAVKENIDYLINDGFPVVNGLWLEGISKNEKDMLDTDSMDTMPGSWPLLKCYTKLTGAKLKEYGVGKIYSPNEVDVNDTEEYEVEAWMIDSRIVYIAPTYHPCGKRPFYAASWQQVQGTMYGKGLYDTIASIEKAANAAARDILKNSSLSSGFIAEVDQSRFEEGAEPKSIAPWSLYRTQGYDVGGNQRALHFHTIPSQAGALSGLHDWFSNEAQKASGIFDFMAGSATEISSALRTNQGVSTVQGNGTKLVNYRAINADRYCFKDLFYDWWVYLMLYSDDESIKVDAEVDIKGLTSVTAQDQLESRAIELLQYLPSFMQASQAAGIPIDPNFVSGVLKNAAGRLGGPTQFMQDPEEQSAIQKAVGANAPATPMPVMDGRSAVPQTADQASVLPMQ
jgi:hypothetical protein